MSPPEQRRAQRREHVVGFFLTSYRLVLSPLLHSLSLTQCRYLPSCSEYAYVAVVRHGWVRGSWLAVRRVARCHPWGQGALREDAQDQGSRFCRRSGEAGLLGGNAEVPARSCSS